MHHELTNVKFYKKKKNNKTRNYDNKPYASNITSRLQLVEVKFALKTPTLYQYRTQKSFSNSTDILKPQITIKTLG